MTGRNILLTGIPRSGTTLACRLMGGCRDTVALFEPMDVEALRTDDRGAAVAQVDAFFQAARAQLLRDGVAPSKQRNGAVPDNPFSDPGPDGTRQLQVAPGLLQLETPPAEGFTLVVKHNASFTALLPELADGREFIAIVRNPVAVLAAWQSVDLPVREGHVPAGERLDPGLRATLSREPDRLARQLAVLDWGFARFQAHLPPDRVLRYEDIVSSQGLALFRRAGLQCTAATDRLVDRNANRAWQAVSPGQLARRLVARGGAWRAWYPDAAITGLAERMAAAWGGP